MARLFHFLDNLIICEWKAGIFLCDESLENFFDGFVGLRRNQRMEGEKAIESTRQTMGATDPKKAAPGTIRADLGINMEHNLIHGSDSPENAEKEIAIFFKPEEVLTYSRDIDRWLTGS